MHKVFILFFTFLSLPYFAQDKTSKINDLLNKDKLDEAEKEIYLVFKNDSISKDYLLSAAGLSWKRGNYLTASKYYQRCMVLDSAEANKGMAILHAVNKEYTISINYITTAIRIDSKKSNYYAIRGAVYYSIANHDSAIVDYARALKIDSLNETAYYNLGLSYFSLSKYDLAKKNFSKAIQLLPSMKAYFERGLAYYYSKEYRSAIKDFESSLKYIENMNYYEEMSKGSVYYYIGWSYEQLGKKGKYRRYLRKAKRNGWTGKLEGTLD